MDRFIIFMLMEKLLHYTWKHRLFPLSSLMTTDNRTVDVIDVGLYNRTDSGPDFFNAKIKVNGTVWAGNVEMHLKASDWYRHGHDKDEAYDSVVLHVVCDADMDVVTKSGRMPAQLVLCVPENLKSDYEHLLHVDRFPPCYERISSISSIKLHSWISALETERLERKTEDIRHRVEKFNGSWEHAYFQTLARNFGFGLNGDSFETWASHIDLTHIAHHRDNLFQLEAYFLGQASLLDRVDESYRKEYEYLRHKFSLVPMAPMMWKYLRTRPQNFPHVRLMQLAKMYYEQRTGLSQLLDCADTKAIAKLFGMKGSKLNLLIINTAIPVIFAYGRAKGKESLCERAFDLFEELKAEDNNVVRMWQECGLKVQTAGESQALLQLKKEYCDHRDCLRCRIGYEYLVCKKPL